MTEQTLSCCLRQEINDFPGQTAIVVADIRQGHLIFSHQADVIFPAAGLIKVPILLTTLEQVRLGKLALTDQMEVSQRFLGPESQFFEEGETFCTLKELLTWMIVTNDDVAANILLDVLWMDRVNAYCTKVLGLESTICRRMMQDYDAAREGRENTTSAADQCRLFSLLCRHDILTPELCNLALSILSRQRNQDGLVRYLCDTDQIPAAHMIDSEDDVTHDCGLFLSPDRPIFAGLCTWGDPGPDQNPGRFRYLGRLGRAIHQTCF